MPCLLIDSDIPAGVSSASASALLAIDLDSPPPPSKRPLTRIYDESLPDDDSGSPVAAVRFKPLARPKSYVQILEEFQERDSPSSSTTLTAPAPASASPTPSPRASRFSASSTLALDELDERDEDALAGSDSDPPSSVPPTPRTPTRKENTARRSKRFSLPAVALQTSPVTARPAGERGARGARFSLVLGKGGALRSPQGAKDEHAGVPAGKRHSLAAGRLSELLHGRVGVKE